MQQFAVETVKLTKLYGNTVGVSNLDLRIPQGSIYGLLGPNGAGKTTTCNILCGFMQQSSGTVRLYSQDLSEKVRLNIKVSALPQECNLPSTIKTEKLLHYFASLSGYSKNEAKQVSSELLKKVGLDDKKNEYIKRLSHGMKKRLQVAQAFLGEPQLIILDEPTAGLDPQNAHAIRELIKSFRTRSTILFCSHNLNEVQEICAYVGILKNGTLIKEGPIEEITHVHEEVIFTVAQLEDEKNVREKINRLSFVKQVLFDAETNELHIQFDKDSISSEEINTQIISILQNENVLISSIRKGKSLEEKYLELM
ncbi:ABC transporter ATP-binding protein [Chlamydiota bacterium]